MISIVAERPKTCLFEMCRAGSRAVGSYRMRRILASYVFASFIHRASCHSLEISWRKANFNNRSWQIVLKKRWAVVHGCHKDVDLPAFTSFYILSTCIYVIRWYSQMSLTRMSLSLQKRTIEKLKDKLDRETEKFNKERLDRETEVSCCSRQYSIKLHFWICVYHFRQS